MSAIVRKTKRSGYKRNIFRLWKTEGMVGKGVISHYTRSCDSCTRGEEGNRHGERRGGKRRRIKDRKKQGGREEAEWGSDVRVSPPGGLWVGAIRGERTGKGEGVDVEFKGKYYKLHTVENIYIHVTSTFKAHFCMPSYVYRPWAAHSPRKRFSFRSIQSFSTHFLSSFELFSPVQALPPFVSQIFPALTLSSHHLWKSFSFL